MAGGRVIPAWAGNICRAVVNLMHTPGHPRVGGEHIKWGCSSVSSTGSSPRGRGTLFG